MTHQFIDYYFASSTLISGTLCKLNCLKLETSGIIAYELIRFDVCALSLIHNVAHIAVAQPIDWFGSMGMRIRGFPSETVLYLL